MSPHLHITIVGLACLALYAAVIVWTLYKLKKQTEQIDLIEDFVKFNAKLSIAKDDPREMMELYNDYQDKVEA